MLPSDCLRCAGDYTYWLEQIRLFKPYTLTEAEEKILNIKNVTGFNALNTLYDSITNRYTFDLKGVRGGKGITRGELMVYVRESDPDVRARAYQELYRVYTKDAPILGQMYQTLVRDWANENVSLRKYKAPISTRNLVNDIPDKVVDTLSGCLARQQRHLPALFPAESPLDKDEQTAPL